jgi:hypothetical protein
LRHLLYENAGSRIDHFPVVIRCFNAITRKGV